MKNPTKRLVALFLLCAAFPLHAADTNDLTFVVNFPDRTTLTITDCDTAASGPLVIPATIGGRAVTVIGFEAFRDCTGLNKIFLPASLTSIEALAFRDCTGLGPGKHPRRRHQHRGWGLYQLHQPDQHHAPRQPHQHREPGFP